MMTVFTYHDLSLTPSTLHSFHYSAPSYSVVLCCVLTGHSGQSTQQLSLHSSSFLSPFLYLSLHLSSSHILSLSLSVKLFYCFTVSTYVRSRVCPLGAKCNSKLKCTYVRAYVFKSICITIKIRSK